MKTEECFKRIYENNKDYNKRLQITDIVWADLTYYYLHTLLKFKENTDPEIQDLSDKLFSSTTDLSKIGTKPYDYDLVIKSYNNLVYVSNRSTSPILRNQEIYFNNQIAIIHNSGYLNYNIRHMNPNVLNYFDRIVDLNNHQEMDLKIKFFQSNEYESINRLFYSMLFFDQNESIFSCGIYSLVQEILYLLTFKTIKNDYNVQDILELTSNLKEYLEIFLRDYQSEVSKIKIAKKGLEILNKNLSKI